MAEDTSPNLNDSDTADRVGFYTDDPPEPLDLAQPADPDEGGPLIPDGWDSPDRDTSQGLDIHPDTDLSPWWTLPTPELVHRLKLPERYARNLKRAFGIGAPVPLDFLNGGAFDHVSRWPIDDQLEAIYRAFPPKAR